MAIMAVLGLLSQAAVGDPANTAAVVSAATTFKAGLNSTQTTFIDSTSSPVNSSCQYNFLLSNAEVWSNVPVSTTLSGATRNGLIFSGLTTAQQTNALAVATAALSTSGKKLFDDVRAADRYISGEVTNAKGTTSAAWGYNKYFLGFVGAPSTSSAFTMQLGGHHAAFNITYNGTYTSGTPLFAGTEPNSWTDSTGTYAPLGAIRTTLESLRPTLTTSAVLSGTFSDVVFGPNGSGPGATNTHDTTQPKAYPTTGRGQLYSALTTAQQAYVRSFIENWTNFLPSSIASELLAIYESPQALAETYVGYAGSNTLMRASANYFRVDGPRVWIEFSVQGGVYDQSGYHDHGVFRDKLADYGAAYGTTTIGTTARPPTITTQPSSVTTNSGATATFTVAGASAGSGTATLSYQWYKDGAAISGATAASYSTTASTTTAGAYTVSVISTGGLATSSAATLTVGSSSPSITTSSPLTGGTREVGYSQTFAASGGTGTYSAWAVTSGTLPGGLSLSTAGVLSGTPVAAGTSTFTVQVTDSASATASKAFALTIANPALSVSTGSPLSGGTRGAAYAQAFAASGGSGTYTSWGVTSGSLPAGLSLSTAGALSGTPTMAGTSTFTVQVTDNAGVTASKAFSLTIANPVLSVTTSSPLTGGTVGVNYSQTFTASGGSGTYSSWSVTSGTLPAGLSLSTAGVLSGTPTAAGTSTFTVQVIDNAAATAAKAFTVTIVSQYSSWASAHFTASELSDPTVSGPLVDYDHDGLVNELERALNLDPKSPDQTTPVIQGSETISGLNYLTLTFPRLISSNLTYTVQVSRDLTTWNSGAGYTTEESSVNDTSGTTQTVKVRVLSPVDPAGPVLVRLQVTEP